MNRHRKWQTGTAFAAIKVALWRAFGLHVSAPHASVVAMPSMAHETLVDLFKSSPGLGAAVPIVTDPAAAARWPELAVLSAMVHGASDVGAAIAAAVLPALRGLDDRRARFYGDLVLSSLSEAARRELETMPGDRWQSDLARRYVEQGRAEGFAQGVARVVLTTLQVRGIAVPEAMRERILAQKDVEQLERWIAKAVVATSLADVFGEQS